MLTKAEISQQILRADDLTYPELERLIMTYPVVHGAPISPTLLGRLILPRLNAYLASPSKKKRISSGPSSAKKQLSSPSLSSDKQIPDPAEASDRNVPAISAEEEYLLLTQILLRQAPRLLTKSHLLTYADLLDALIRSLTPLPAEAPAAVALPTPAQRLILRSADLFAYS